MRTYKNIEELCEKRGVLFRFSPEDFQALKIGFKSTLTYAEAENVIRHKLGLAPRATKMGAVKQAKIIAGVSPNASIAETLKALIAKANASKQ